MANVLGVRSLVVGRNKGPARQSQIAAWSSSMRKAFRLGVCSIVVLNAVFVFATGQRGDILFLDGKKHFIFTNPLSPFLDKNPEKLPESKIVSTSLWRGYVATWEVRNDRLVLIDVGMLRSDSDDLRSVMSEMFPSQKDVLADWYSGHVIIPNGKLLNYVHMGYASTYKKY